MHGRQESLLSALINEVDTGLRLLTAPLLAVRPAPGLT